MCGVAGAINVENAADAIRVMLHATQNRGQQAAGIISYEEGEVHELRGLGAINNFPQPKMEKLSGSHAIGHIRYATAKNSAGVKNIQPFMLTVRGQAISIAHNGNFTNAAEIEANELEGTPFMSESDTERFFRLILREHRSNSIEESIVNALKKMRGSCSAVLALPGKLIAIKDPSDNRPLCWGRHGSGFVITSETCGLDSLGVLEYTEVEPGTIVTFSTEGGVKISDVFATAEKRPCTFEDVYFKQITSNSRGSAVAQIRLDLGRELAHEHPVDVDVIAGIPDSGTLAGVGYSEINESGLYSHSAIIRRHNTGRTFIRSVQHKRERSVDDKFGFSSAEIRGKRILLVDDSLVRGTTSARISASLRERGATEIHWRIPCPQVTGPCHYGIATKEGELLATNRSNAEMAKVIGADSLEFLSMEKFKAVLARHGLPIGSGCFACMDANYWH